MKKVGLLVGRERTFPVSLIESINERGGGEVIADFVKVGGVRNEGPVDYDLIIDRISHEVPFYRAFLKRAALEGTVVINNPFWWSADDKFFNFSLATKLGVAIPKTVLLPQKDYIEGITGESLRNLEFPLDWQAIADYVGFPAYHQALRRRRLEERLEGQQPRRTLEGLRHDRHALHDLAGEC